MFHYVNTEKCTAYCFTMIACILLITYYYKHLLQYLKQKRLFIFSSKIGYDDLEAFVFNKVLFKNKTIKQFKQTTVATSRSTARIS